MGGTDNAVHIASISLRRSRSVSSGVATGKCIDKRPGRARMLPRSAVSLSSSEEDRREPCKPVAVPASEQPAKQQGLLSGDGHTLGPHRIEAAYGIAERKQPAWERIEPLEVPPHARRKAEPDDVAEAIGMFDRVMQGWGAEPLREGQEPV